MNRFIALLFLIAALALPAAAFAQRIDQLPQQSTGIADSIAAVVNDNVISTSDINARLKLAMLSSGLPDTPEVRQHLMPQILRGLIDEQLQMQEAKRLDITVPDTEINQTLTRIATDNHIDGDMKSYIASRGGSPGALVEQVRAAISWSKVVQRELRPHVDVGDDEVEAAIQRIRENVGKQEYLVSEIFLAVDQPKDEEQVRQLADNLVEQLKSGANFAAVAHQFSQGSAAASGGDIGWIQEGQLPSELSHALSGMDAGEISRPVRAPNGYHILGVRDKRTVSLGNTNEDLILSLQQVFHAYLDDEPREDLLHNAEQLRAAVTSCDTLRPTLDKNFPDWHWQNYGDVNVEKTPSWLSDKVRGLPVGSSTVPMATDKGALIFFVCGRKGGEGNIDREAITNSIGTEKLELQARRLLRDLRRSAYLDIRMSSANPS